jgi:hypothetical protein
MSDGDINVDSIDGEVSTSANIVGQLYPQGEKGDKGDPGNDGFSPIITTEKVGKTTTITIVDAEGTSTATILDGADGQGSGDMLTSVYDTDHNGIVDNAEKVNNFTVGTNVPADAVFTDTTYTAGTGIDITNGVITNTQTSAEWGNITGTLSDQTDLNTALSAKADTSSLSTVATSGSYEDLSNKPSIPTKVSDLNNDSGFIDKDVNNLTNYDTSTTVNTKISDADEVLIGSDSGIKASHDLWVDTSDVTPYINSEISNDYGTAQNLGYSQEYQNAHNVVVSITEPTNKSKVWLQHSGNLYDVNNITDQSYISSSSGTVTSVSSWCISNYMEVEPGEKITINGNASLTAGSGVYGIYYDSSKNVVSAITYADYKVNGTILTIPSGVSYVRLSVPITEKNTFKVYVEDKTYILNTNNEYEEFNSQVESGSNTNGNYIKYADGTLINTIKKSVNIAINNSWGSLYYGDIGSNFDYPMPFINGSDVTVTATVTGGNTAFVMPWINSTSVATKTDRFALFRGNSTTSQDYVVNVIAIGRWK